MKGKIIFNKWVSETLTEEEFVEQFKYFTNPERKDHISLKRLKKAFYTNPALLVHQMDPTFFDVIVQDLAKNHNYRI